MVSISIAIRQTKKNIVEILNKSGLPIDVIDMLLGELKEIVHTQAESEYQNELLKQQEEQKKNSKKD